MMDLKYFLDLKYKSIYLYFKKQTDLPWYILYYYISWI